MKTKIRNYVKTYQKKDALEVNNAAKRKAKFLASSFLISHNSFVFYIMRRISILTLSRERCEALSGKYN